MEPIMKAIAKARADRASLPIGAMNQASSRERDGLWERLPEFTPAPRTLSKNRLFALSGTAAAAEIDMFRTRMVQHCRQNGWRKVGLTSPTPGCGKSTTALNLALSLSRQSDIKTMLLELDLRRPSLLRMLGHAGKFSFHSVLAEEDRFENNAFRIGPNLIVGASATHRKASTELLSSNRAASVLEQIQRSYRPDILLFDMTPMLVSDDAIAVMPQLDAVMLMAGADTTSVAEVDLCEREIVRHSQMFGVILNKCRFGGAGYGYGYNYAYGN